MGIAQLSLPTLAVGIGTIVVLTAAIEQFRPRWPAPLIAVAGAIAGAGLFAWQSYGIELVGAIPAGLPSFALPDLQPRASSCGPARWASR